MFNRLGARSKTLIAVAPEAVGVLELLGLFWWFQRDEAAEADRPDRRLTHQIEPAQGHRRQRADVGDQIEH